MRRPILCLAAVLAAARLAGCDDDRPGAGDGGDDAGADVGADADDDADADAITDAGRDADAVDGDADLLGDGLDADADTGVGDASADADTGGDADGDTGDPTLRFVAADWTAGALDGGRPPRERLLPLPGGGVGGPVLTSNNPEEFHGVGLLYGNARPSPTRGGTAWPLEGDFGVYLHHLNRSGAARWVTLLVTNPNDVPVVVSGRGSGLTQTETGGLGLGQSPDFHVSEDWLLDEPTTTVAPTSIDPRRPLVFWRRQVNDGAEVDGRFALHSTLPVYVYVVATTTNDPNDAVNRVLEDAPGDYRVSGTPPPPFGREAGVYAHDTWQGRFAVEVPAGPANVAWMVNTATGSGLTPSQAFPALAHLDQSAAEAVGMYGNVYDLTLDLEHAGPGASRRVRVTFSSLVTGAASRYWDGVGELDGVPIVIRHTPASPVTELAVVTLLPGERRTLRFRAMVPGLTSIPQALALESL